jgi:hypothetical protein
MLVECEILLDDNNGDVIGDEFIDQRDVLSGAAPHPAQFGNDQESSGLRFSSSSSIRRSRLLLRDEIKISTKSSMDNPYYLAYSEISGRWLSRSYLSVDVRRYAKVLF